MKQIIDTGTFTPEPGCYVDGHWGWRGVIHQVEQFNGVVYELAEEELELLNRYGAVCDMNDAEAVVDLSDAAEEMLNNALPDGYLAHWHEGEFYISPRCDDDQCEDPTCAHWC